MSMDRYWWKRRRRVRRTGNLVAVLVSGRIMHVPTSDLHPMPFCFS